MNKINATIFNQRYDLEIEYERNENGNILKSQLEILEMFISYVLYDYLNTSNLLAIRDPNYKKPKSQMDILKDEMEGMEEYKPYKVLIHLPKQVNTVDLYFKNNNSDLIARFVNNQFKEIIKN